MNILILNFLGFLLHLPKQHFPSLRSCRCRLPLCQLLPVWSGLAKGISSGKFINVYFLFTSTILHSCLTVLLSLFFRVYLWKPITAAEVCRVGKLTFQHKGQKYGRQSFSHQITVPPQLFYCLGYPWENAKPQFWLVAAFTMMEKKLSGFTCQQRRQLWNLRSIWKYFSYLYVVDLDARALKSGMKAYMSRICSSLKEDRFGAMNEETGRSLMQANVNLLYRSTSFYTLPEAARF